MDKLKIQDIIKKNINDLNNICRNFEHARQTLDSTITFNNEGFKHKEISCIYTKANTQLSNLKNKILPEINNM